MDQLVDHFRIDDDTWARLAAQLDERQLVEVAFVVGTYACLAMLFNSVGIQLEAGIEGGDVCRRGRIDRRGRAPAAEMVLLILGDRCYRSREMPRRIAT